MSKAYTTYLENLMLRLSLKELEITALNEQQQVLVAECSHLWRRIHRQTPGASLILPTPYSSHEDTQVLLERIQLLQQDLKIKVLENQVLQDSIELGNMEATAKISEGTQTRALPNYPCVLHQLDILKKTLRGQTDLREAADALHLLPRPHKDTFPEESSIGELTDLLINLLGNGAYKLEMVSDQLVDSQLKGQISTLNRTEVVSDIESIDSALDYGGPVTRSRGAEADASNRLLLTELPVGTHLSAIPLTRSSTHQSLSTRTKGHKCDTCHRSFTEVAILKQHVLTHSVAKDLICDLCGKAFIKQCYFDAHVDKHNGIRYRCSICNKDFISYVSLGAHLKKMHPKKPHPPVSSCGFLISIPDIIYLLLLLLFVYSLLNINFSCVNNALLHLLK